MAATAAARTARPRAGVVVALLDREPARALVCALNADGWDAQTCARSDDLPETVLGGGVDLAVVEAGCRPYPELLDFCRHPAWRRAGLMLVCRGGVTVERALAAGALDAVSWSASPAELLARIRARLRPLPERLATLTRAATQSIWLGADC